MATDHRKSAVDHAARAQELIESTPEIGEAGLEPGLVLQRATAEAVLAVFHQLRAIDADGFQLRGAADLADSLDRASRVISG